MFNTIWTIARLQLLMTFSDRNVILIMLVTPLALATIIGLAFGGFARGDGGIEGIRVALVNEDQAVELNGQPTALGDIFEQALIPPEDATETERAENSLWQMMETTLVEDVATARRGVEDGDYAAAILIPADFTAKLAPTQDNTGQLQATVEVYSSPAAQISASVAQAVGESITTQIVTRNLAIDATVDALVARSVDDPALGQEFLAAYLRGDLVPVFTTAVESAESSVTLNRQTATGEQVAFNPFVVFGTGQAVFFMMFMAMSGASALLYEKRDGTLKRLLASPTPRAAILLGKLLGAMVTCIVQVLLLLAAFTVISSLLSGQVSFIFGTNGVGIAATIFAVALAASGLATLVMSAVMSPEQGDVIGGVISMAMGLFGGAFFNIAALGPLSILSRFTVNYWGVDAFTQLSQGNSDILPNLLVLVVIGGVTFVIGFALFNRRLEA